MNQLFEIPANMPATFLSLRGKKCAKQLIIFYKMKINFDVKTVDFKKVDGLVPAIIQDAATSKVLMMGYMNEEALLKTCTEGVVTFFSRSKNPPTRVEAMYAPEMFGESPNARVKVLGK